MSSRCLTIVVLTAAVLAGGATGILAQKPVTMGAEVSETAVIHAIDTKNRIVTLKIPDGTFEDIYCGPEVQRFDALKVGDTVTFRYYESIVYAIQQPGATPPKPDATAMTRAEGTKPGGTISRQMTATVTVLEINPAIPSVTISTADGNKMSFKVEDKKNIEGVKVGDKVQITYSQALAISVQAPGSAEDDRQLQEEDDKFIVQHSEEEWDEENSVPNDQDNRDGFSRPLARPPVVRLAPPARRYVNGCASASKPSSGVNGNRVQVGGAATTAAAIQARQRELHSSYTH